MTRWAAVSLLLAALFVSACGGDSDDSSGSDGGGGTTVDASGEITGDQVCSLISGEDVGKALDFDVTEATPQDGGTPGCIYFYDNGREINGVALAVLRPTDVEDNEGKEAFDYVLELNRVFGAGASEEKVSGVGDQAVFMTGKSNRILIVQDKARIITLAGQELTKDGAAAIGKKAAANLK